MFYTGDANLRAIEECNLQWRRRILGGSIRWLARTLVGTLAWAPRLPARHGRRATSDQAWTTGCQGGVDGGRPRVARLDPGQAGVRTLRSGSLSASR